jgi:hypothetical protein
MMTRLVPNIFYNSLSEGLDLFVTCLGFKVLHQDAKLAVIERDGAKAYIVESAEFAAKDRPQITIETDSIDELLSRNSVTRAAHASSQLESHREETMGRAGVRRPGQDRRLRCVSAVLTVADSGWSGLGQQAVELAGVVECPQFVKAADDLAIDENFGDRAAAAGHLDHLRAQLVVVGHVDFIECDALALEQAFGARAEGAIGGCVNFDFRHVVPR